MPDGRLMLVTGGTSGPPKERRQRIQSRVAFSADGQKWTPCQRILNDGDWLWRVTWHDQVGYGVAYRITNPEDSGDPHTSDAMYSTRDGITFQKLADLDVPDGPSEATVRILPDTRMLALVRRNQGNQHGWIGESRPPYTAWSWRDAGVRLAGPNFLRLPNGELIATARMPTAEAGSGGSPQTALAALTERSLSRLLTLPSGGDTGHPGLAWKDGTLWVAYYSSHEAKTAVYLARVAIDSTSSAGRQSTANRTSVDLLSLVDVNRDAVKGQWTRDAAGNLISDGSVPFCRIAFPYHPPEEYDFRVEFTASGGNDILQLLAHGGTSFSLLMGGWGGKWDGFDTVRGFPFTREGTKILGGPSRVRRGQRRMAVVQVRKGSIAAYVNDELVAEHRTDYSDLGIPPEWSVGSNLVGLGTTFDRVTFHRAEIVEVTGQGKARLGR
jgi:hypothetical protein